MNKIPKQISVSIIEKSSLAEPLKEFVLKLFNLLLDLEYSSFDCHQLLRLKINKKKHGSIVVYTSGCIKMCFKDINDFNLIKEFLVDLCIKFTEKDLGKEYYISLMLY